MRLLLFFMLLALLNLQPWAATALSILGFSVWVCSLAVHGVFALPKVTVEEVPAPTAAIQLDGMTSSASASVSER